MCLDHLMTAQSAIDAVSDHIEDSLSALRAMQLSGQAPEGTAGPSGGAVICTYCCAQVWVAGEMWNRRPCRKMTQNQRNVEWRPWNRTAAALRMKPYVHVHLSLSPSLPPSPSPSPSLRLPPSPSHPPSLRLSPSLPPPPSIPHFPQLFSTLHFLHLYY